MYMWILTEIEKIGEIDKSNDIRDENFFIKEEKIEL